LPRPLGPPAPLTQFPRAAFDCAATPAVPSSLSNKLFDALLLFTNTTTSRVPLTDWYSTVAPVANGFMARPVYGALYAPPLIASLPGGMGHDKDAGVAAFRDHMAARRGA
jgi:hypothetical protein